LSVSERSETYTRPFRSYRNRAARSASSYTETERRFQVHARGPSAQKPRDRIDVVVERRETFQRRTTTESGKFVSANQLPGVSGHGFTSTVGRVGPYGRLGRDHFSRNGSQVVRRNRTGRGRRKRIVQLSQGDVRRRCRSTPVRVVSRKFFGISCFRKTFRKRSRFFTDAFDAIQRRQPRTVQLTKYARRKCSRGSIFVKKKTITGMFYLFATRNDRPRRIPSNDSRLQSRRCRY